MYCYYVAVYSDYYVLSMIISSPFVIRLRIIIVLLRIIISLIALRVLIIRRRLLVDCIDINIIFSIIIGVLIICMILIMCRRIRMVLSMLFIYLYYY